MIELLQWKPVGMDVEELVDYTDTRHAEVCVMLAAKYGIKEDKVTAVVYPTGGGFHSLPRVYNELRTVEDAKLWCEDELDRRRWLNFYRKK